MSGLSSTLAERSARYGDFTELARISQDILRAMMSGRSWASMPPWAKESLILLANKQARLCNGDFLYADSWHDIAGYAKLGEERCGDAAAAAAPPAEDAEVHPVHEGKWWKMHVPSHV